MSILEFAAGCLASLLAWIVVTLMMRPRLRWVPAERGSSDPAEVRMRIVCPRRWQILRRTAFDVTFQCHLRVTGVDVGHTGIADLPTSVQWSPRLQRQRLVVVNLHDLESGQRQRLMRRHDIIEADGGVPQWHIRWYAIGHDSWSGVKGLAVIDTQVAPELVRRYVALPDPGRRPASASISVTSIRLLIRLFRCRKRMPAARCMGW